MIDRLFKKDLFPLILLLVCLLAYGVFSPFLGFYWDDFPYMWFNHTNGPLGAVRAIALDRPVLGLFYTLPLSLLGESPLPWQLFAILCRWVFTLSTLAFLSALFPQQRTSNRLITLLFTVFPGVTQQYISVIYSHAFLIFALYFYSLVLFIHAVKEKRFIWIGLLAVVIALICMAATEYLVGLEVLRPFIIFLLVSRDQPDSELKQKIKQVFKVWLPYLIAGLGFVFYRVFLASSVLYKVSQVDDLTRSPFATLVHLLWVILQNIYTALVAAWIQIIQPFLVMDFQSLAVKVYLSVFVFAFFATAAGCLYFLKRKPLKTNREYVLSLLTGGILVLIFAGLPFWAANFRLDTHFPADRFFLPFMLASSSMIFLPLTIVKNKRVLFSILFGLVFSLSLSFHVFQANIYRNEWDRFKDFIAQISWRIPSLAEDTLLVTDELTLQYYSDNSLTAAFNWVYADPRKDGSLPYLINFTKARLGRSLPSLTAGTPVVHNYRTHQFMGSTDQMVMFYHLPPGCFHVADPDLDPFNPLIDASIRPSTAFSRTSLIGMQSQQNAAFFLTEGTSQSWCYYYQKASLAAKFQDWQEVVNLAETAFNLDDHPNDASERIPYIEAYAMTGNWQRAFDLTEETDQVSPLYQPMLCRLWERVDERAEASGEKENAMIDVSDVLGCEL